MMKRLTPAEAQRINAALKSLAEAAQELGNVVDEIGYPLSNATPEYIVDVDDFTYEISSWVEDEREQIESITIQEVHT